MFQLQRNLFASLLAFLLSARLAADSFVLDPPSPGWPDSDDILVDNPGPISAVPRLGIAGPTLGLMAQDVIDAISDGRDPIDEGINGPTNLLFSVHRQSVGVAGTGVNAEQVADAPQPPGNVPNGQASDLFYWDGTIGMNVLAPAGLGWTLGLMTGDEANTHLRPVGGGSPGDDVTAYDVNTMRCQPAGLDDDPAGGCAGAGGGGGGATRPVYFSLRTGSPTLAMIGAGPGDILVSGGAYGPMPQVFLSAAGLGIPAQADLDALALEVTPVAGGGVAVHQAKISVNRNTLGFMVGGVVVDSGATVLLFDGAATTVAHSHADLGLLQADELDALESILAPQVAAVPVQPPVIVPPPVLAIPLGDAVVVPVDGGVQLGPLGPSGEDGALFQFPYATGIQFSLLVPAVEAVGSRARLELPVFLGAGNDGNNSIVSEVHRETDGFRIEIEFPEAWRGRLQVLGGQEGEEIVHEEEIPAGQGGIAPLSYIGLKDVIISSYGFRLDRGSGGQPDVVVIESAVRVQDGPPVELKMVGADGQTHTGGRLRLTLALPRQLGPQLTAFSNLVVTGATNGIIAILIGLIVPGVAIDGHGVARLGEAQIAPTEAGLEISNFTVGSDDAWGNRGFAVNRPALDVWEHAYLTYQKIEWVKKPGAQSTLRLAGSFESGVDSGAGDGAGGGHEAPPQRIEAALVVLPNGDFGLAADFGEGVAAVKVFATRQGEATGSVSVPAGQIGRLAGAGELVQTEVGNRGFVFGFSGEMTLTLAVDGAALSGDSFRIRPIGGDFDDAVLAGVEVRASDVGTIVIARITSDSSDIEGFHRGDSDRNGELNLTDAIATLRYLFFGDVALVCKDAADTDDDGTLAITDPIRTLAYLYLGGVTIPNPAPGGECGADPTEDALGCKAYNACE